MFEDLKIICWPDPRLLKSSQPVESFDENLKALVGRMFTLMREAKGVGLAAPQVGLNIRLFVMNATGKPEDDRVFINPILDEPEDEEEGEEGCLSLPGLSVKIVRPKAITIVGKSVLGQPVEQREVGYLARVWQHEFDHLNGTLLVNRMGPVARMANRRLLKDLETQYLEEHPPAGRPKKRPPLL